MAQRAYVPDEHERAVMATLRARHRGAHVAMVAHDGGWIHAAGPHAPGVPWGAAVDLVQGVRERFVGLADLILRRRIFTSAPRNDRDHGLVKVAAQRITFGVTGPGTSETKAAPTLDVGPDAWRARRRCLSEAVQVPRTGSAWCEAQRMAEAAPRRGALRGRDRSVGAVLVDARGRPLLAARNLAGHNRTLHAEIALLQGWWMRTGGPPPAGFGVRVTLQCCRMCAAALVHAGRGDRVEVRYRIGDPGPLARATSLQAKGWEVLESSVS